MEQYRTVDELTPDELDELKQRYFYDFEYMKEEENKLFNSWEEITDNEIKKTYLGIGFVRDDFWCNICLDMEDVNYEN